MKTKVHIMYLKLKEDFKESELRRNLYSYVFCLTIWTIISFCIKIDVSLLAYSIVSLIICFFLTVYIHIGYTLYNEYKRGDFE